MSRALLILANDGVKARAKRWIDAAPAGTRVEFKEPKRSLEQNAKMWAALSDISAQKIHCGRKLPAETWKVLFMDGLGREIEWIPSLDGTQAVPIGHRSSDLSKDEMSELIEFITAWATENGVTLHDASQADAQVKAA